MFEAKESARLPNAVSLLRSAIIAVLAVSTFANVDVVQATEKPKSPIHSSLTSLLDPAENNYSQPEHSSPLGEVLPIIALSENVKLGIGPIWNNTEKTTKKDSNLAGVSVGIKWRF